MRTARIAQRPEKTILSVFGHVFTRRRALSRLDPNLDDGKRIMSFTLRSTLSYLPIRAQLKINENLET
jgi:hypothetical protein